MMSRRATCAHRSRLAPLGGAALPGLPALCAALALLGCDSFAESERARMQPVRGGAPNGPVAVTATDAPAPPHPGAARTARRTAQSDAALRSQCEAGTLQSCVDLAVRLRTPEQKSQRPDLEAAFELLHRACDGGSAAGCSELGLSHQDGLGVERDPARAADLYRRACDAREPRGCSRLGSLHLKGHGVSSDVALAHAYTDRGCVGGDGMGCVNLGLMHQRGDGAPRDAARAAELFERACTLQEARGCTLLGELHASGTGVEMNAKLAEMFAGRGCALGDGRACGNQGVNRQLGFGAEKNPARAAQYYKRACEAGEQRYCELLERFERAAAAAPDRGL